MSFITILAEILAFTTYVYFPINYQFEETQMTYKTAQEAWFNQLSNAISTTQIMSNASEVSHEYAFSCFKNILLNSRKNNGTIWLIGNGGSTATCSHIAQDIMNRLAIRTETLNSSSLLTCISNDDSFEHCFLKPISKFAKQQDTLIALSCSGESKNILNTALFAKESNLSLITLSAMNPDNSLNSLRPDLAFWVPSDSYGIAEVAHHAILHNYVETLYLEEQSCKTTTKDLQLKKDSRTSEHLTTA